MTAIDLTGLAATVAAAPLDAAARLVYADALEESGDPAAATQRAAGEYLADREMDAGQRAVALATLAADLIHPASAAVLERDLAGINGRRRERTLDMTDVHYCVVKAASSPLGWAAIGGGTVANSYSYPAVQTACFAARRTDGRVRVSIDEANAKKNSSLTTPATGLAKNAKPEQFRAWADAAETAR